MSFPSFKLNKDYWIKILFRKIHYFIKMSHLIQCVNCSFFFHYLWNVLAISEWKLHETWNFFLSVVHLNTSYWESPRSVPWNLHWMRIIYTSLSSSCPYCPQSFWSLEASQIVTSGLLTQSSDISYNNSLFPLIRVCVQPNQPTNQSVISMLWHHCSGSFLQHGNIKAEWVRVMGDQWCACNSCLLG